MKRLQKQKEIISLMETNETLMQELYELYAHLFPQCADTWLCLAHQERGHAKRLEYLKQYVSELPAETHVFTFDDYRFTKESIIVFANSIRDAILRSKVSDMTLQKAATIAMDLEGALLERRIFELFSSTDPDCRAILAYLAQESKQHFETIKELKQTNKCMKIANCR